MQVWLIPLADGRGTCKTVRSLENACHTWAPMFHDETLHRSTFTFTSSFTLLLYLYLYLPLRNQ